ncbi:MarR family winged helix-turn-helix transcriptional regulator [Microbacterium tumbae]
MENVTAASDQRAWESYQRMRVLLSGRIAREVTAAAGLSEADYDVLSVLARQSEPIRPTALGCGLDWEKSRLSHQLRRMEQRGLILRDSCIDDGRGQVVSITAAGREVHEKAKIAHDAAVCRYVTDVLTAEQLDRLQEIAETVLPHLEEPHGARA